MQSYIKCLLLEPYTNPYSTDIEYYQSAQFNYQGYTYYTKILNYANEYLSAANTISYKTQHNLSDVYREENALMLYNGLYGYALDDEGHPTSSSITGTVYPILSNDPNKNKYMYLYNGAIKLLNNSTYQFYANSGSHTLPVLTILEDPWINMHDDLSKKIVQYDTWFENNGDTIKGPRILTPDIYPLQLPHILDFLEIGYASCTSDYRFDYEFQDNTDVDIYIKLTYNNHLYNKTINFAFQINTVDTGALYYTKLWADKNSYYGYIDEKPRTMKIGYIPIYDYNLNQTEYSWSSGDKKQILLGNSAIIRWNRAAHADSNSTAYVLGTQYDTISFNGCFILITYNKNNYTGKDYSYLRPITIAGTNIMNQCYFGNKYNTGFLLKPNDPGCTVKYIKYFSTNYITITANDDSHDIFSLLDNILSNILPNYNSSEHTYYTTSGSTKVNHYIVCNSFRYWDEESAELFKNFNIKSYQQTNGGYYEHINVSKNLPYCLGALSCANDAPNYIQFAFIIYDVFVFPAGYLNAIPLGFFTIDNVKYNIDRININNITNLPIGLFNTYIDKSNASLDYIKANYPNILSISRTFVDEISNKYMYKTTLDNDDPIYGNDSNEYYPDLSNKHHSHNWYYRTQTMGSSANPANNQSALVFYVNRFNVQQATTVSSTYYTDYVNDNDYFYTLYRASKRGLVYTTKDESNNTVAYMYSSDTYQVWPNNYAALALTEYSYSYSYSYSYYS